MTEQTQPAKEEKKEAVLMAKVDEAGNLSWEIPDNMQVAAWLLMHLNVAVQKKHAVLIAASMKETIKKPNIITAIKNSPIIKGLR
jgi:phosphoribosyl-ATP pyrophosphohydrolase